MSLMSFVDRRKIDPTLFPHRPKDTKERNIAISMSENAWKKNVQIAMSEKIIRLKNCSVPTQEPKNAKERNNAITFKYIISVSSCNNLSNCIKFKYVYKYKQWIQHTSNHCTLARSSHTDVKYISSRRNWSKLKSSTRRGDQTINL